MGHGERTRGGCYGVDDTFQIVLSDSALIFFRSDLLIKMEDGRSAGGKSARQSTEAPAQQRSTFSPGFFALLRSPLGAVTKTVRSWRWPCTSGNDACPVQIRLECCRAPPFVERMVQRLRLLDKTPRLRRHQLQHRFRCFLGFLS